MPIGARLEKVDGGAQLAARAPVEGARRFARDPLAALELPQSGQGRREGVALVADAGDGEAFGHGGVLGHGGEGVVGWRVRHIESPPIKVAAPAGRKRHDAPIVVRYEIPPHPRPERPLSWRTMSILRPNPDIGAGSPALMIVINLRH